MNLDPKKINQIGWDQRVAEKDIWTQPVTSEQVERARNGDWQVILTPTKPVPRHWFGDVAGRAILCLASGGGQQGPILAAAGASVTVLDACEQQLRQDQHVAAREGLALKTVQGFMDDLSCFANSSFDLIFHPVSNCFAPAIAPVWRECFRVLKCGGALLAGFANPAGYIFDEWAEDRGELRVRFPLPYSDVDSLNADELEEKIRAFHTVEFSHSLDEQIGGQLRAGFVITDFYEDGQPGRLASEYFPTMLATRAVKPLNAIEEQR